MVLFIKFFKHTLQSYRNNLIRHQLVSRNLLWYSSLSTKLSNNIEYITTADITPACLLKIISASENDEKLLKIIDEIKFINERNYDCPKFLNSTQMYELYILKTKTQRIKYLRYLFKQEKVIEKDRLRKEERRKQNDMKLKSESNYNCDFTKYGLGCKTLLLSLRKESISRFQNQRLADSVLFGHKIVIDMEYDKFMVEKEKRSCVGQLRHLIVANRRDCYPFDLYFCNANPSFKSVQYLKHDMPNVEETLNTFYEGSYLNIFPREHLVYLSPHASESLQVFDPSAIYIIGGFVDVVKKDKISTEKASIEGIKSYKLPLDEYVKWKSGSKSLTVNQVFEIMLNLKNTGDWKKAFKCIPIRKTAYCKSSL